MKQSPQLKAGRLPWPCRLSLILTLACVFTGCGGDGIRRVEVNGSVNLDGQPLPSGDILFMPVGEGPTAGGEIVDGKFHIGRDRGPSPGEHLVRIEAFKKTGRRFPNPGRPDMMVDEVVSAIPAKYNDETELRATLDDSNDNQLAFELASN